ncbi:hypothetical protein FKM82_003078 [Ascaphus truei]
MAEKEEPAVFSQEPALGKMAWAENTPQQEGGSSALQIGGREGISPQPQFSQEEQTMAEKEEPAVFSQEPARGKMAWAENTPQQDVGSSTLQVVEHTEVELFSLSVWYPVSSSSSSSGHYMPSIVWEDKDDEECEEEADEEEV